MKNINFIILFLISTFAFFSCQQDSIIVDEQVQEFKEVGNLLINTNNDNLASRINYKDEIIPIVETNSSSLLKSAGDFQDIDLTKNYVFKLKAEVASPVYNDNTLQASHVKIHDNYAFVTYNTQGAKWLGGIEIFDVTDEKNPVIISSAILDNMDVSAIDYYDGKIYIVGARGDYMEAGYVSPAFLEVISLTETMAFEEVDAIIDLPSYAGTDIKVVDGRIYATCGSDGGLTVFDTEYNLISSEELTDVRSVDANSDKLYVLQGQEGRVNVFGLSDAVYQDTYNVGGANTPESKSEIAVTDDYIFTALNEGGLSMLNLDGSLKQNLPRPETPEGSLDENNVTNSVSINNDLVLIGNGESGVHIGGLIKENNDNISMLGAMKFNDYQSTNFVESKDNLIFVATGLGGLKIIGISIDEGVPDDVEPTKPCTTLMDKISKLFPESKDARVLHEDLFSETAQLSIRVTKETPVYVSFINEGASWKNTFGYYTYNENNPPQSIDDLETHIVFPNVSKVNEGGGLDFGDRVQLGDSSFPAGTVIGFYIVARGWKNGLTVDGDYTHYTDRIFNINQRQQSTLFLSSDCDDIVLTFEDVKVDLNSCDHDYNDIILTIKDTKDMSVPNTKLDISGLPRK
ncbi:DUF4114 domain-containing protein [Plebeiibacterium sediminum]|uniref:DUF4114 domain-containing protein n=1 Tax=Plebeiibacterium sediminum TaxID=2992112 RepID=A0AAE3M1U8_9BACT|nr:DUF4114 domain-containing protein [Plebeiobacterium sediminum]MCW3785307.1 DUF4114 domain-containing protein [Plebeiobacterium sediminum]